jgi:hypothetical protein
MSTLLLYLPSPLLTSHNLRLQRTTTHHADCTCRCSLNLAFTLIASPDSSSPQNTASSVAQSATSLATSAAVAVGLTSHPHNEEHAHRGELPPDSVASKVMKMDSDGLQVFEEQDVRHEVLVKINKLAK